jgi:dihydrofolate synthase / folylpolyglutamate synthase
MICRVFWLVIMQFHDRYNRCLQSMFGLRRFGIKLGLDTILSILNGLDNPQDKYLSIHIAGTNGKGSIASSLSSVFIKAGYRVGLYTSPHLVKFNERIRINGVPVSDMDVLNAYEAVKDVYAGEREPTFFEYTTAMAFHEFARTKVDWAIVETGMGGRLDATNVLQPRLSIISNISLEHRQYLGNSIAEITAEKGGIIKHGIPVVTGVNQKEAVKVLKGIAQKQQAPLFRLGEHFRVRKNKNRETFSYIGVKSNWDDMKISLKGNHQIENAALTLAACEVLNYHDTSFIIEEIKEGLLNTEWPGRMEVVSRNPYIIIDGAHNFMAARKLAEFMSENLEKNKTTLILGILDDKPYKGMLKSLLPHCRRLILTKPAINRAMEPEILHKFAKDIVDDIKIIPSVKDAFYYARESVSSDEAICVAGSLYVVGEVKQAIAD